MANAYNTDGVIKGDGGQSWGGKDCSLESAGMGTDTGRPKGNKDGGKPGGVGSSGTPSTSKKR